MIHFYKPNAKVTGTACSFWFNNEENTFFSSMIKQDSWNSQKRTGSFIKNKSNPKATVIVKFSPTEIGGIIDSIESNREFSTYHSSQNQISKIKFGAYIKDDKQLGFSYTVNKESKEDSTDKSGFVIGFKYPEARLLKQYLINALNKSFKFFSNKSENTNYENRTPHEVGSPSGHQGTRGERGRKDPVETKEEKDSFDW